MGAKTITKTRRFENIEIQFVNLNDASSVRATVLLRGAEMVIDIQNPDDHITDYLIIGKPTDYYFKGRNSATGDVPKVLAMWTKLGQSYVGEWIEDGEEFLFSFELKD
jgi:hypothetical protein